eukprot:8223010-Pyramimonas_sp.AAC.2
MINNVLLLLIARGPHPPPPPPPPHPPHPTRTPRPNAAQVAQEEPPGQEPVLPPQTLRGCFLRGPSVLGQSGASSWGGVVLGHLGG